MKSSRLESVRHKLFGLVGWQAVLLCDGGNELPPVWVVTDGYKSAQRPAGDREGARHAICSRNSPEDLIGEMVVMWAGRLNDIVGEASTSQPTAGRRDDGKEQLTAGARGGPASVARGRHRQGRSLEFTFRTPHQTSSALINARTFCRSQATCLKARSGRLGCRSESAGEIALRPAATSSSFARRRLCRSLLKGWFVIGPPLASSLCGPALCFPVGRTRRRVSP